MATLELTIDTNYVPDWNAWHALRELLQNALDARDEGAEFEAKFWPKTNRLVIKNTLVGREAMNRSRLLLGATSKLGTSARGQFGEGFKLALLTLTRKGVGVTVHTPTETWVPEIAHSSTFDAPVLQVKTRARQSDKRTVEFIIQGIDEEVWDLVRSRVLDLTPPQACVKTRYGTIIKDEDRQGHLYVGGLYVAKLSDEYRFGYDFPPEEVLLDRDRKMADPWRLRAAVASVLSTAVDNGDIQIEECLARGSGEVNALAQCPWAASKAAEAAAKSFADKYGDDAVAVDDMADVALAAQHGLKAVVVSREERLIIEHVTETLESRLNARGTAVKHVYQPSDLTQEELSCFNWAVATVRAAYPDFKESSQVVDFFSDKVCGVRAGSPNTGYCISLARTQLVDRATCMATLLHEVAHQHGADGTSEHRAAIERIAGLVIAHLGGGQ